MRATTTSCLLTMSPTAVSCTAHQGRRRATPASASTEAGCQINRPKKGNVAAIPSAHDGGNSTRCKPISRKNYPRARGRAIRCEPPQHHQPGAAVRGLLPPPTAAAFARQVTMDAALARGRHAARRTAASQCQPGWQCGSSLSSSRSTDCSAATLLVAVISSRAPRAYLPSCIHWLRTARRRCAAVVGE